ncbi:MAG: hypothetical protein KAT88_08855 [Spirochaetes bacterium]|nr:hypothetical protein [Spirochaetota bacterium]
MHEHRQEGGKLNFICQTASEMENIRANIRLAAKEGAFAVYHHGTETGNYWREGRIEELREIMKTARDAVVVGMFPKDSDRAAENAGLVREFG